ncbi:hypothetical protein BDQ12DRAFT_683825 [Crucibulum laeve]|uniref:Uncharacterized protein n=1 Tax=Crucibulum laeve TaxID=68775 RepID=A0A5C3M080_9AGAR|nr:hypothetical protein BDQ12DRAFT_683825 [Crucibulum laeve]
MANWIDFLSLIATIGVFGGVVYGVILATKLVSDGVQSTKESLKKQGLDVSDKGVSIKTSKRFDRQDYIDATQRGIMKTMDAASFRKGGDNSAPTPVRSNSQMSTASDTSSTKKKSIFSKNK